MAKERQCIFCGKTYTYCPTCNDYSNYPKWMFNFDTEKCHDLYDAIGGYNIGVKTKDDVKAVIDKYNITNFSQFSPKIKNAFNKLFPKKKEIIEEKIEDTSDNKTDDVEYFSYKRGRLNKKKNYTDEANTEE